jgi:hypothetical protein
VRALREGGKEREGMDGGREGGVEYLCCRMDREKREKETHSHKETQRQIYRRKRNVCKRGIILRLLKEGRTSE